jgi:hypothetical protein
VVKDVEKIHNIEVKKFLKITYGVCPHRVVEVPKALRSKPALSRRILLSNRW